MLAPFGSGYTIGASASHRSPILTLGIKTVSLFSQWPARHATTTLKR